MINSGSWKLIVVAIVVGVASNVFIINRGEMLLAQSSQPCCNGQVPENPAPYCGGTDGGTCEERDADRACNGSIIGAYKVATSCESPGGSSYCKNATARTDCTWTSTCKWNAAEKTCEWDENAGITPTYVIPKVAAACKTCAAE